MKKKGGEKMKSVEIEVSDERLEDIKDTVKEIKKNDLTKAYRKSELVNLIKNCQLFTELEANYNVEDEKVQILF